MTKAHSDLSITGVRVVRDCDGTSKGIAYVDLGSEKQAKDLVEMMNGYDLFEEGIELEAQLSQPPKDQSST